MFKFQPSDAKNALLRYTPCYCSKSVIPVIFFFIILCVKFWLLAAGRLSYLSRPIYAEWTLLSPLLRHAHILYKECQSNFHYWRCLCVTQLPGSVKNLDTYIFIITIFCRNFYIQCKQCRPRSDAAFCGVRSGSTLFVNSPFYGMPGLNRLICFLIIVFSGAYLASWSASSRKHAL